MSIEKLGRYFVAVEDPRCSGKVEHRLVEVLVIAVCAVIACAESWNDIALYGRSKLAWLRTFLELANGIPSHDTFRPTGSAAQARQDAVAASIRAEVAAAAAGEARQERDAARAEAGAARELAANARESLTRAEATAAASAERAQAADERARAADDRLAAAVSAMAAQASQGGQDEPAQARVGRDGKGKAPAG